MNTYWTIAGVFKGVTFRESLWGMLHRKNDLPAIIYGNGNKEWWVDGKLHREGAPAIITQSCNYWYRWSSPHRIDGPAVESLDGMNSWYLNGYKLSLESFIQRTPHLGTDEARLMFYLKWK